MAEGKPKPEEKGRFIVERQYVDDRRIHEPKKLDAGGIDVSGRWGVLIEPRTITDFDHSLMHEVQRQKGGEHIHRCFRCGNCTAACPTAEEHPAFNPRYFIHAVRMGYPAELEKARRQREAMSKVVVPSPVGQTPQERKRIGQAPDKEQHDRPPLG